MASVNRSLTDIANTCGTDKGTLHGQGHGYTAVYETFLAPYRDRAFNLLEIGLARGGPEVGMPSSRTVTDVPSIRMWREYFPNANLYGIDISDFTTFQSEWFTFFQADCGNVEQLERVSQSVTTFDVIIDDGSHASFHQQLALCTFFKNLNNGGLYFIEDLQWLPETYQRELPRVPRTETLLGNFIATGEFTDTGAIPASKWARIAPRISTILFFDEDTLLELRRLFNMRTGARPQKRYYLEFSHKERIKNREYLWRLKEQVRASFRALRAEIQPPPRQWRPKLAVIQKC